MTGVHFTIKVNFAIFVYVSISHEFFNFILGYWLPSGTQDVTELLTVNETISIPVFSYHKE